MLTHLRTAVVVGIGAVALVLALAACGSSKKASTTTAATSTTSGASATGWANSVCSSLATWKTSLQAAGKTVKSNPTKAGVQQGLTEAQTATKTLKTQLTSLNTPTSSTAQTAKTDLQTLQGQLQNDFAVLQRTIKSSSGTAAVSTIQATIATMRTQVQATLKQLSSLSGSAGQSFSDSPACQSLTS